MVAHYNKQGFRGRWLEDRIVQTNNMYRQRNIALVTKVPTPTAVTRKGGQLVGAKYTEKSIVDFVGIYHTGQFIAFDTKECQQTSFPFKNVKEHQEDYLNDVKRLNGIAFILIFFRNFNEMYLVHIDEYMTLKESLGRKSIPYQWFKDNKVKVKTQNGYYFDYLNSKSTNI